MIPHPARLSLGSLSLGGLSLGSLRLGCLSLIGTTLWACAAPVVEPPPPCGGELPERLEVVEGGRLVVARTGELAGDELTVGGDLEARVDAERVVLRAPYGEGERTARFTCATGVVEVAVDVRALRWGPVLDWDEDEAAGAVGGREYFAWWLGVAPADRALYVYGGFAYRPTQFTPRHDLYRLDLETLAWSSVAQRGEPPEPGGRVVRADDGSIHYFGGAGTAADGALVTSPAFARWERDAEGGAWSPLETGGAPGSYTGALVYDRRRARWLSICGADARVLGIHCRVHELTAEGGWRERAPVGERAPGRYGFHYAYDEEGDRVVVFAGQVGPMNDEIGGDTWALDLSPEGAPTEGDVAWTQIPSAGDAVTPRRNGAFAFDPAGRRLFVWGGTPDGRDSVPGLDVLSLDEGSETWTHLELPDSPDSRTSGQGILDEGGARILWGFGNDAEVYTDLWSLEL